MDVNIPAAATPSAGNSGMADAIKAGTVPEASKSVTDSKSNPSAGADGKAVADAKLTKAEAAVIQKIKVGDTEYDETTLTQMIEKAKGADKKFLQAAQERKAAMRLLQMAKSDPEGFLRKTGLDPEKYAYDKVAQDIQKKLRDPKEVELEEATKRIKEYEAKENEAKQKEQESRLEKEAKALEQKFHAEIIDAMEAFPELPRNGHTVAQIAKAIDTIRQKHGIMLTAKEVAPQVVSDIKNMVKGVIAKASPEQLEAMLGEEAMKALRAYDIARLKNPLKGDGGVGDSKEEKPKAQKWKNPKDFWKSIDKAAKQERGEI